MQSADLLDRRLRKTVLKISDKTYRDSMRISFDFPNYTLHEYSQCFWETEESQQDPSALSARVVAE